MMIVLGGGAEASISDGMIHYWGFDGDYSDSVGGITGTPQDGVSIVAGGSGQCLSVDGANPTASLTDGSRVILSGVDLKVPVTAAVWVYETSFIDCPQDWWTPVVAVNGWWPFPFYLGYAGFINGDGTPESCSGLTSAANVPTCEYGNSGDLAHNLDDPLIDGQWNLLVMTDDGVDRKLYLNGNLNVTSVSTNTDPGIQDIFVGGYEAMAGLGPSTVDGLIDEFALWDRALSEEDVARLWQGGGLPRCFCDTGACNPLPMDEATGVELDVSLSWSTCSTVTPDGYRVFFGEDPNQVLNAVIGHPYYYGEQSSVDLDWSPSVDGGLTLEQSTEYSWRIDEVSGADVLKGFVWSFTTFEPFQVLPEFDRIALGGSATFTAVANAGIGAVTSWQWYKVGTPDTAVGLDQDTYTVAGATASDHGQYYVVATTATDTYPSNTATLTVEHMIGNWNFDDQDLTDATIHGNYGVLQPGGIPDPNFVSDSSCGNGYSMEFGGLGAIEIGAESFFDVYDEFSVSCWVKPDFELGSGGWEFFVAKDGLYEGWYLGRWGATANANFRIYYNELAGGDVVSDGGWHLVTGVYSSAGHSLYIDGVLAAETAEPSYVVPPTDSALTIGGVLNSSTDTWSFLYSGLIDDVRLYNYDLTLYEAAGLYTDCCVCDVCVFRPQFDVDGPSGDPDCVVNLYDLVRFVGEWAECGILPVENCL